jgi:hypothetical protein
MSADMPGDETEDGDENEDTACADDEDGDEDVKEDGAAFDSERAGAETIC